MESSNFALNKASLSHIAATLGVKRLRCRFIILEADAAVTPWSRICISHADCVLLVGAEEASPQVRSRCLHCLQTQRRKAIRRS